MKAIVIVFVTMLTVNVFCVEVSDELLSAIAIVESQNGKYTIGDNGSSIGVYQLRIRYVDDVNRIYGKNYSYNDRNDFVKSREIVVLYLKHYGKVYERKTGKKATNEILSRIHNGGPRGYAKSSTEKYWKKIKNNLK